MNDAAAAVPPRKRRWWWLLGIAVVLLLLIAVALRTVLRPDFATGVIIEQVGRQLGLEITTSGPAEYDIRGTPRLVLRGLRGRQPGHGRDLLTAERLYLLVPWETLKTRGHVLDVERAEIDAPVLDLAALQAWRGTRPSSAAQRLPTLTRGLRVVRGTLVGEGWSLDGITIDTPFFAPQRPLAAHVAGRYVARTLQLPFDLHLAMSKPATEAALGLAGTLEPIAKDWRLPMRIRLSAPMHWGKDGFRLSPAKLGANVRYLGTGGKPLPFIVGAYGTERVSKDGLDWSPLALALRGEGVVPDLDARGSVQAGTKIAFALDGRIRQWPDAWPRLPAPLDQSRSPLPFSLGYDGALDLSDVVALDVRRDATRFDGRLHIRDVLVWRNAMDTGSPLPPIDGHLSTPRLDIAGARLEGIEIEFEELTVPDAGPRP